MLGIYELYGNTTNYENIYKFKIYIFGIFGTIAIISFICLLLNRPEHKHSMYKGFMLDCARVFFDVQVVKTVIYQLYLNNYTHLHLGLSNNERFSYYTQFDNGQLALANNNTQFYTKNDIIELIQYGQTYNITVYGEFEFMGHVRIWKYVYPEIISNDYDDEFDMNNPQTYSLLTQLFNEVIPIFTNTDIFHMANDEISQPNSEIKKSINFAKRITNNYQKYPIIWDDAIIQNDMQIDKDIIIQAWHNEATQYLTNNNYKTIISEMDYWYIGGQKNIEDYTLENIQQYKYIYGAELVWFTDPNTDDPKNITWIFDWIQQAGIKMNEIENNLTMRANSNLKIANQ